MTAGLTTRHDVSLDLAQQLVAEARAEASRRGMSMGIAVVDTGGNVVAAARMDGAQLVALQLATDKAYTAVAFGRPSEAWAESSAPGGSDWGLSTVLQGRLVVFAGGLPIVVGDEVVGGLGLSGGPAEVDRACAEAALASIRTT